MVWRDGSMHRQDGLHECIDRNTGPKTKTCVIPEGPGMGMRTRLYGQHFTLIVKAPSFPGEKHLNQNPYPHYSRADVSSLCCLWSLDHCSRRYGADFGWQNLPAPMDCRPVRLDKARPTFLNCCHFAFDCGLCQPMRTNCIGTDSHASVLPVKADLPRR